MKLTEVLDEILRRYERDSGRRPQVFVQASLVFGQIPDLVAALRHVALVMTDEAVLWRLTKILTGESTGYKPNFHFASGESKDDYCGRCGLPKESHFIPCMDSGLLICPQATYLDPKNLVGGESPAEELKKPGLSATEVARLQQKELESR